MGDAGDNAVRQIADNRRFVAFISYSHADAPAAAKLQRKLERYTLPKHIAAGRDSAAVGRIFRDREDLAAASSLSAAIRDAIGQAEALIVMCSPDAAASPWVAAEIELFRELHPGRPILAVLVSGQPSVSFPIALTAGGLEPLAADLRPEGDGAQLGFLKVVAGIAGVPLDALIQRDAQRRIRRVTAITVGALAAMLVMGIMTMFALQARNEAAHQRAAAEGLVEYMLTDLREKLKGVGRLDVMGSVNERATQYYGGQTVKGQLLKARILHAIGEDEEVRGKFSSGSRKFTEAHRITQRLLSKYPSDPDTILIHAQSEYWVGESALRRDDFSKAAKHFQSYKKLSDRLASIDAANLEWLRESGYANGNLCTLGLSAPAEKLNPVPFCQRALQQMQAVARLSPQDPSSRKDVANRFAWLADAWKAEGNLSEASIARSKQEAIIAELRQEYPTNMEIEEIWLKTQLMVADILVRTGNLKSAETRLANARLSYDKLVSHDPANQQWRNWKIQLDETNSLFRMHQQK